MVSNIKQKRVGRPPSRVEELVPIPTRCPESLHRYCKAIYPFGYASLTAMYAEMLAQFISTRPWEHGLEWRQPRARIERSGTEVAATGWRQINVLVPAAVKERVSAIAATNGVTNAVVVYTAMFWWAMYIMPAGSVQRTPKPPSH